MPFKKHDSLPFYNDYTVICNVFLQIFIADIYLIYIYIYKYIYIYIYNVHPNFSRCLPAPSNHHSILIQLLSADCDSALMPLGS